MNDLKKFRLASPVFLFALVSLLFGITGCTSAVQSSPTSDLISVVAISRHGIRSPTIPLDAMNAFTTRPQGFSAWPSPANNPGYLSTVGQQNATRLGSWYRDFYSSQGLLPPKGTCPAPNTVYAYADLAERTLQTAQGYVDGLFKADAAPNCGVTVKQTTLPVDPYIVTARAGIKGCTIDTTGDLIALNNMIGNNGNPAPLIQSFSAQIQSLQAVTQCCQLSACVTKDVPNPTSCSLMELPTNVISDGAVGFAPGSIFGVADNLTETFELEYAQGMPNTDCASAPGAQCVGWGAIRPGILQDMSKLHVLNMVNLSSQLPSYAQVGSTNLMWQLVGSMDQAQTGVRNHQILAPLESKFTLFVAHDENIAAISGFLGGLTWKADGFEQNDPGPAGALVFELHKSQSGQQPVVRIYYVIASLDQQRTGAALTLQTPPQRLSLAIPACGDKMECPYDQFKDFITTNVAQSCVVTTPVP